MKRILNEWRKFLILEGAPGIPFDDDHLEKKECVYQWSDGDEEHHIILYRKQKYVDEFYVIGYIAIMQITEPSDPSMQCIPNTFQVSAVYVEPELQGKNFPRGKGPRYGTKIYDLAFAALPDGAGLTSDKFHGTLPGAKKVWDKMSNSPQYKKRETDDGNTVFDYTTRITPNDPQDDCVTPYNTQEKNASKNSLMKTNKWIGVALLEEFKENHESNDFLNKEDFEKRLFSFASFRFSQLYSKLSN